MKEFFRRIFPLRLRRWIRWLRQPQYRHHCRELARLQSLPRYTTGQTDLLSVPLQFVDAASLLSAYAAIFDQEIYRFDTAVPPRILDCGANIGLATIYWKTLYPAAVVTAFEPDPQVFAALAWNCERRQFTDVQLVNQAVWNAAAVLAFIADGADGGRLQSGPSPGPVTVQVSAVRLRDYLTNRIDLLKLDIEGAECAVLVDCADHLTNVARVFVEYHSVANRPQELDTILAVLKRSGFRVHIQPELVSEHPFRNIHVDGGMDQRLNIFAYRTAA